MKVVKKGRPQKGWSKEFKCTGQGNGDGGCGAKLLVEQDDVFETSRSSYGDPAPEKFATFSCCECGVLTDIKGGVTFSIPSKREWAERQTVYSTISDAEFQFLLSKSQVASLLEGHPVIALHETLGKVEIAAEDAVQSEEFKQIIDDLFT
jgi:hypothetical protein